MLPDALFLLCIYKEGDLDLQISTLMLLARSIALLILFLRQKMTASPHTSSPKESILFLVATSLLLLWLLLVFLTQGFYFC